MKDYEIFSFKEKKETLGLLNNPLKKEISKVPSLSEKWEIHGKLQSPPRNSAPTRLHRRCFFPSTRGPGRTHLWCTSYRAHGKRWVAKCGFIGFSNDT